MGRATASVARRRLSLSGGIDQIARRQRVDAAEAGYESGVQRSDGEQSEVAQLEVARLAREAFHVAIADLDHCVFRQLGGAALNGYSGQGLDVVVVLALLEDHQTDARVAANGPCVLCQRADMNIDSRKIIGGDKRHHGDEWSALAQGTEGACRLLSEQAVDDGEGGGVHEH